MLNIRFQAVVVLLLSLWQMQAIAFTEDLRLDANVAPTFQAIELHLDAQQTSYNGKVIIELNVKKAADTFRFHAEQMHLDKLTLEDAKGTIDVTVQLGKEGLVYASTNRALSPGVCTLAIEFSTDYNTKAAGLYRVEQDSLGYLFTQFEAIDARKAFPCWDEPAYKIPFQLTVHIPTDQVVLSNTPVATEEVSADKKTVVFQKTKPLPTYLLAIAAGPLESAPIKDLSVPGRIYTVKGLKHLAALGAEMTPPILRALEQYFGSAYPFKKLDFIAIPEYWPGAMEHPGAITFKDDILLLEKSAATLAEKRWLAYVIAHELAHMWFGDLVTMTWWDDLWLNESFADWLGEKTCVELFPEYKVDIEEIGGLQNDLNRDARPSTKPIRKKVESGADISEDLGLAYSKGKKVLGMIEQWIGPEAFRNGVLAYLDKHAWGNANAEDLWSSLSAAANKDVAPSLSSFITQSGYPMISAKILADGTVRLSQKRFLNYGVEAPEQQWTVPLRIKYSDGKVVKKQTVLLSDLSLSIDLGKDLEWILPDADAYGYYRWNVPFAMIQKLLQDPEKLLTERERVAFMGNISALLDAGVMSGDAYLSSISAFAKSTDPGMISGLLSNLRKVKNAFVPPELETRFAFYVRKTLQPALAHFGMQPKQDEEKAVSLLRPDLLRWLGNEGQDEQVRKYAKSLAQSYIADRSSVNQALVGVALRLAAIDGGPDDFRIYTKRFEEAQTPTERANFLSAMGAFANPEIQKAALQYTLSDNLRPNEIFTIPFIVMTYRNDWDLIFEWMANEYDEIAARIPREYLAFMPRVVGGCSEERLEKARVFFENAEHQVDGTLNNLEKTEDTVMDCVNLRAREGAAVAKYLNGLANVSVRQPMSSN